MKLKKIKLKNTTFKKPDRGNFVFTKESRLSPEEFFRRAIDRLQTKAHEQFLEYRNNDNHDVLPSLVIRVLLERHARTLGGHDLEMAQRYLARLESAVGQDTLTGISNRSQYDRTMARRFARVDRQRRNQEHVEPVALAVIDIDHFKAINTAGGHPGGDMVLKQLAKIIQGVIHRSSDTVFRYGGEEFVLLMPQTSVVAAQSVAERVRTAVAEQLLPAVLQNTQPGPEYDALAALGSVTVSIGVSALEDRHQNPQALFGDSDAALYAAKEGSRAPGGRGRNRVEVFDQDMRHADRARPTVDVDVSSVDLAELTSRPLVPPTATPEELFDEYERSVKGAGGVTSPLLAQRKLYPTEPIEGIQLIFSRPEMRKAIMESDLQTDILHLDAALRVLEQAQLTDALTLLPNRRAFDQYLRGELAESTRDFRMRGLIIFDLDHFKKVNDTYGHVVGDVVLYHFGRALAEITREGEFACRLGGEEFALVATVQSATELAAAAERFRARIEEMVMRNVQEYFHQRKIPIAFDRSAFTVSAGGTLSELREVPELFFKRAVGSHQLVRPTPPGTLYARADKALYVAKGQSSVPLESWQTNDASGKGRNRWVIYDPRMDAIKTGK